MLTLEKKILRPSPAGNRTLDLPIMSPGSTNSAILTPLYLHQADLNNSGHQLLLFPYASFRPSGWIE